ncbi:hypothetical protein GLOIN_2v1799617 [Rhizophagus irregularis DAOM 181602=DAOM 197198]|uniref:Uncharacterized protein n=1 Tax=Rhizophagus irregularis (strain DAOM 181602 / DAOM 197198 / MUCL 43194) TaxID=747089 RepID=A0A2P4QSK1_RHIID|nr:hypothetical protein GLOIN_2v1799617 [Rhizophagus irregularis DAOM 181602=DAOM 197198]POG80610.1 hypothetical protein GLOIN_2v1799617 [Rhizophagus irregularis DAOM 181602=DAOM 197198]|eukprot:XP_025187476.1 hypothetical protein GLOIN_2v1799617 [Rhizophagus irregularis DAOM 181602=DAOM 197198]
MDAYKETKILIMTKLFKGQNGVCVIICMIVIVGLLFVQITALIVDIINVPRKGLANEEIDFLFGIVVESSLARSNSVNEIDNKKRRKLLTVGDYRLGPRSRDRFNIFDWPDWPHDRVMFICLSNLRFSVFSVSQFSRSFSPSGSVIKIF